MNDAPADTPQIPQATFMNFLSGLSAQALMQFGEIPNPLTGQRSVNGDFARYTVELLQVLSDRTTGNRTPEEDVYLASMLSDFRRRLAQTP